MITISATQAIILLAALCSDLTGQAHRDCKDKIIHCTLARRQRAERINKALTMKQIKCESKIWHPPLLEDWIYRFSEPSGWGTRLMLYGGPAAEQKKWMDCDAKFSVKFMSDAYKDTETLYEECAGGR